MTNARSTAVKAAGFAAGAAAAALLYRIVTPAAEVTYPPLDRLKPLADGIWTVDSGPISAAGLKLPVRMTVIRLSDGGLFLHSPTRFTADLARELQRLGRVRHLVAPTTAHWTFLKEWQRAYPGATTWGVPGLRDRPALRRSGIRIDRELGPAAEADWSADLDQGLVPGGAGFREAYFLHRPSRTLLLADLIENLEPAKLPPLTGVAMWAAGATRATTARHVRAVLRANRQAAEAAIRAMLALAPERVIFAHGRTFDTDGADRLRAAFAWIAD